MNRVTFTTILLILVFAVGAFAQEKSYLQNLDGNWAGTLEYSDYSNGKRVKLKTYLIVKTSPDGNSAEVTTVYDDFGRIIKSTETIKIGPAVGKFTEGSNEYTIESSEPGKLVLTGSGQDGEKVEPIRRTITFDENSVTILKETRTPWQFRHQYTFKRTNENVLEKKVFSPAQMREDLAVLKKTLITLHPGIYRYNTPEGIEKLFTEIESKTQQPMSEGNFFVLISQLTTKLHCGHTYTNPYNQDSLVKERLFNQKTYLPFYFRIVGGKFIVTENASPQNLSKGSEIKSINGVSTKQIIEKLLTVSKGDGLNTLDHRINSIELSRNEAESFAPFDWFFPLFFPLKDGQLSIEAVDFATKKTLKFTIRAVSKSERTAELAKRYGPSPTYDDGWKFEIRDNNTGYLKIDNSITWRLKKIKFKEFLANAFAELKAKNVQNLIIDVRGNGGGSMDPGFELSRYLTNKKLAPYAEGKRLVRNVAAQPEILKYLNTYSDELIESLKSGIPANSFRKFDERYFEITGRENYPAVEPYENSFKGKTYIIADSSNASATFQFLNYIQENGLAIIVGQKTGGNKQGINGGNYFFLSLPHSKVEVDIPVYFQAPLKPQKDESVIADILITRQPGDIGKRFDREIDVIQNIMKRQQQ